MLNLKQLALLLLGIYIMVSHVYSQGRSLTGTILDSETGQPLPGATVLIKGTTTGSITDLEGQFQLEVNDGDIVIVSFIGYIAKEIEIKGQTTIEVTLIVEPTELSEIVVIGYGTQKKVDKTGAVAQVTSEELNGGVLTDPIQALQGKTAGVSITKKGGDPSAEFSVKIRGSSGLYSETEPLYVVDGVPGVDPTTIAPEDIASFNILKDASSTAIYGSRGANGVVIITTKKGTTGKKGISKSFIDFNSYISLDRVAKRLDMLSADQIRQYVADNGIDFQDGLADVDWQDQIYRDGYSQSYNLAASGGSDNTTYRASVTHSDFVGVVIGSSKKRTMGRLNLSQKAIDDRLTITTSLSGTFEANDYVAYDASGPNDILYQAFQRNPTDPVYDDDGEFYEIQRDFNYYNPVALAEQIQNERTAKRYLGNLKADFEIIRGLKAGVNLGYTNDDSENFYFEPTFFRGGTTSGYGRREYDNFNSKILEATLSYDKLIEVHSINLVGGYSFQEDSWDGFKAEGNSPQSDIIQSNNLATLNDVSSGDIKSYKFSSRLISFFGRAVYNYNSKYYVTGTLRRDGSSRFGRNNEWGLFPSGSVAWNIKNEPFMESADVINQLKLRVGYGLSGNQEIWDTDDKYRDDIDEGDIYVDVVTAGVGGTSFNPETGDKAVSIVKSHNANPDLKWESNREINLGLDFSILNNRISGSLEYYDKTTFDLIAPYAVPQPPNILPLTWANAGEISNRGFETNLQFYVTSRENLNWKSSVAFSTNKQEIVSLSSGDFEWSEADKKKGWLEGRGLVGDQNWTQLIEEGNELGTFYMPEYAGLSADGKFLFWTEAGGVTRNVADAERRVVGKALPDFEIGWSNYFKIYKDIDLSFSIRWVQGNDVLNVTRMVFSNPTILPTLNALEEVLDEIDRGLDDAPKVNSYYIENGSFVKIDNLTIGYNLNVQEINWVEKFRLYFTSNNLYTFTNYTGLDPESTYDGLDFGLDLYNVYPKTRTYTLGLQVTF